MQRLPCGHRSLIHSALANVSCCSAAIWSLTMEHWCICAGRLARRFRACPVQVAGDERQISIAVILAGYGIEQYRLQVVQVVDMSFSPVPEPFLRVVVSARCVLIVLTASKLVNKLMMSAGRGWCCTCAETFEPGVMARGIRGRYFVWGMIWPKNNQPTRTITTGCRNAPIGRE